MPYRRLPKTDKARIAALRKVLSFKSLPMNQQPVSGKQMEQAEIYLRQFTNVVSQYSDTYKSQVQHGRNYYKLLRDAKMYVSHFIQVVSMAYQRGEIKREHYLYYKLDPDRPSVPDITTEAALIQWGQNIIGGEKMRVMKGGAPITFPSIALVQINFQQFHDKYVRKQIHHDSTSRTNKQVKEMHAEVDTLITMLWDSIEAFYADLLPYERMEACRRAGVIYYYRPNEKHLTPEDDEAIRRLDAVSPKLF